MRWIAVLLVLVVAAVVLWLSLDGIAKRAVERGTTYATGVPTRVGDLQLGLISGELALQDMRIANPEGYEADHFLALQALDVGVHPRSLLEPVVRVPRLTIDGVQLNLERAGRRSNFNEILDNVRRLGDEPKDPQAEPQKRFIVDELRIEGVQAKAIFAPELGERGRTRVQVPAIALDAIGADSGGVTMAQLAGIVAKEVLDQVVNSGMLPGDLQEQLGSALGRVQNLEGEARQEVEKQRKQLEEEAGRAIEEQRERLLEEGRQLLP